MDPENKTETNKVNLTSEQLTQLCKNNRRKSISYIKTIQTPYLDNSKSIPPTRQTQQHN